MRIFLPEHRSADENARLSDVARQADMAWRQPGHPDWYAAREDQDGEALLDDFRQLVALPSTAVPPFALPTAQTVPLLSFPFALLCLPTSSVELHNGACTHHCLLVAFDKPAPQMLYIASSPINFGACSVWESVADMPHLPG